VSYTNTALAGGSAERRDGPRRICRVRASVALPGHEPLPGITIDIGRDGMAVLLDYALPAGLACDIGFSVFAKNAVQRIEVRAQVASSIFVHDRVRVSFSFSKVGTEAQRVLNEFVGFGASR
jgi:c-di-GMP-binding flagellar brake protein YcgR